tara:strand:+ start:30 stop:371 length:342 start_codon:yes stop_codon:yes gene_type:complete
MSDKPTEVIDYNDNINMDDILEKINKYILLYFTASWCGPCKKMAPIIKEKFTKINNLDIYKIDIDDNDNICTKYNIKSVPTFILIKDKQVKMRFSGSDPIKLLKNIQDIFNTN